MIKYIFKNFDNFLELLRSKFLHLFSKDSKKQRDNFKPTPYDILEQEIQRQEINLEQKETLDGKLEVRKQILYLKLKLISLKSGNKYIKRAMMTITDGVDDSVYEALAYIERIPKNLDSKKRIETHLFKALLHEILEDFDAATHEYKEALKLDKSEESIRAYKEYVERTREFMSWHSKNKKRIGENSYNLHNILPLEKMPEVAKNLENIAKYYARSPKSRALAKSYFYEVLKIYKKLAQSSPQEYTCDYIHALLDGVEIFMLSPLLLQEAQDILVKSRDCIDMRVFLLERIKELKQKSFIQKSLEKEQALLSK